MIKATREQQKWVRDIVNKHNLTLSNKKPLVRDYDKVDRTGKVRSFKLDLAKKTIVRIKKAV